jgi:hypothetical protein
MAILPTQLTPLAPVINDPVSLKMAALEARIAALEAVLKIAPSGDVTIKSMSNLSLEASSGAMLKCGSSLTIDSAANVNIKTWGSMSIQSSATMTLKGSMINLN